MSWNITVNVENGVASLQENSYPPPDGSYTLGGHEDPGIISLNAYVYGPDGVYKAYASAFMRKPPPVVINNAVEEIATPEAESSPE